MKTKQNVKNRKPTRGVIRKNNQYKETRYSTMHDSQKIS